MSDTEMVVEFLFVILTLGVRAHVERRVLAVEMRLQCRGNGEGLRAGANRTSCEARSARSEHVVQLSEFAGERLVAGQAAVGVVRVEWWGVCH